MGHQRNSRGRGQKRALQRKERSKSPQRKVPRLISPEREDENLEENISLDHQEGYSSEESENHQSGSHQGNHHQVIQSPQSSGYQQEEEGQRVSLDWMEDLIQESPSQEENSYQEEENLEENLEDHSQHSQEQRRMLTALELLERDAEQQRIISENARSALQEEEIIPLQENDIIRQPQEPLQEMDDTPIESGALTEDPLFQFRGVGLFATYPRCLIKKEYVLSNCRRQWGEWLKFAVIAEELHKDSTPHIHCYIKFKSARQFTGSSFADFLTRSLEHPLGQHGNYRLVKKPEAVFRYVTKGGNFLISGTIPKRWKEIIEGGKSSKKKVTLDEICQLIISGKEDLPDLMKKYPGKFMLYKKRLEDLQQFSLGIPRQKLKFHKFSENPSSLLECNDLSIRRQVQKIYRWLNENLKQKRTLRQKQLYINGPHRIGKTSLIELLHQYLRIYILPLNEDFYCKFDNKHDLITVDEFASQKPITFMNQLLDGQIMELKKKGVSSFQKTRNLPVIVCSNLPIDQQYKKIQSDNWLVYQAFKSRFVIADLSDIQSEGEDEDGVPIYPVLIKPEMILPPEQVDDE